MSCTLYLVRHGIAGPTPTGMSDADRSLTAEGERKMIKIAAGLKRLGVLPDAILSSPLRRAEQTAALIAARLAPDRSVDIYAPLAPGNPPAAVLQGLGRRQRNLMLVGHQPDLGQLASYLLTGSLSGLVLPFRKGAVAAIRVGALPARGGTELLWFLTPKQLRLIAR